MSDEQRKDEETEVEGHWRRHGANEEPGDEVEGHLVPKNLANEEPDDEVEGHVVWRTN